MLPSAVAPPNESLVPTFVSLLKDKDPRVRAWGAAALGRSRAAARSAIPALTPLLKDADEKVRDAAETALDRIKTATREKDSSVRPRP